MFPPAAGESGGGLERRRRDSNPQVLDARRISSAVPYQLGLRLLGSAEGVCWRLGLRRWKGRRRRWWSRAVSSIAFGSDGPRSTWLTRRTGSGIGLRAALPSSTVFGGRGRYRGRRPLQRSPFHLVDSAPREWDWPAGGFAVLGRLRRSRLAARTPSARQVRIPLPPFTACSRREWDSNPRGHRDQRLSRAPLLAAQPSLQVAPPGIEPGLF